ncbi:MAG: hypothetical protein L6R37_002970 [Teloschistes peruensis]|nr:MAG: hypothetical protein L6R37_002970 [Teloschistes peruensis]
MEWFRESLLGVNNASDILTVISYPGYTIGFAYSPSHPPVVGWSIPEDKDTGFVNPGNYSNPDIICHKGATPAALYATVPAGGTVELQWSKWPDTHHGPVIDYLANCNGECTSVDKTKLQFNKIDGEGLLDGSEIPGKWAADKLLAANDSWTVNIPSSIAPGNYVLRHEIIALHSADKPDGAQNYPQCINLKVTGSGTDKLASGTVGTELYKPDDAGIFFNIYTKQTAYPIPGPALYSGASSGSPTSGGDGSSNVPIPSTTASPTSSGYDGVPTGSPSSMTLSSTAAPMPTGNLTSPYGSPPKKGKKPCKSTSSGLTNAQQPTTTTAASNAGPTAGSGTSDDFTSPSSVSSPAIPTITSTPSGTPASQTGSLPKVPEHKLLEGLTVKELLEWLNMIVAELESRLGQKTRRHARDFLGLE